MKRLKAMKKILFLLPYYFPTPDPNGICIQKIIEALDKNRYKVFCICYEDGLTVEYTNASIYKISKGFLYYLHSNLLRHKSKLIRSLITLINILIKIKNIPFLLTWPMNDPIFTKRVYDLTKKLHKINNIDIIIAVHMPFSSLMVGHKIKNKFKEIEYIAYFLDSLSGGLEFKYKLIPKKFILNKKLKWEKKLLYNADKIVCMESSKNHHIKYNKDSIFFNKIQYLDLPMLSKSKKEYSGTNKYLPENTINIVYLGSAYYPTRNIPYFLSIFNLFSENNIYFTFIGNTNCEHLFNEYKNTKYFPTIPYIQVNDVCNKADIFLNLSVKSTTLVASKLIEYISYGKPIISAYSIDNDACKNYLEKYPLSFMYDERNTNIELQAQNLYIFIKNAYGKKISYNILSEIYKNNKPETFISRIL